MHFPKSAFQFLLCGFLAACLSPLPAGAEVRFSDLDLREDNQLLFRARSESPGQGSYDTLLTADLGSRRLGQLTFFPEKATLLMDRTVLQIQNRFGVFRSAPGWQGMQAIAQFPSFTGGHPVADGKVQSIQISPDGRYLLTTKAGSSALGSLVLQDLEGEQEVTVSEGVERSLQGPAGAWSWDSAFFVYSKAGRLYYFSIGQLRDRRVPAEEYRQIGNGQLGNVQWGRSGSLYYLTGDLVYELDSRSLFTRALYSGFLKIGTVRGKIPFDFDPNFDRFWISPDGSKILLDKGGRNVFLYILSREDFLSTGDTLSLPYLYLPRNTRIRKVVWSFDRITLLAESLEKGRKSGTVLRLSLSPAASSGSAPAGFARTSEAGVTDLVPSPEGERIALVQEDRVSIRDAARWKEEKIILHPRPLHALWVSEDELIVAGAWRSERVDLSTGEARLISLSQPQDFGWSRETGGMRVEVRGVSYSRARADGSWEKGNKLDLRERSVATPSYRVYLEEAAGGGARNQVMVRDLKGFGTTSLLTARPPVYEPFPAVDEPVDLANFNHGSRIRQRELALVFNVVEDIEGLPSILTTLAEYGLQCTFFVNGEAIRRHPDAVREIAESGHEVGSLFYAYFNMTDSRFQVDKEFIKRGLARNEDDYFAATGRELSLLWHAPFYFVSSLIIDASREMNYTYVGRDVDPLDWVTRTGSLSTPGLYFRSAELVERIIRQKKPGSIVPVLAGLPDGQREDYLFQNLDTLIDGLIKRGYRIVPVSTLIEQAR